jgi:phage pi2 protein 07
MRESIEARALVFSNLPEEKGNIREAEAEEFKERNKAAWNVAEIREDPAMILC